MSKSSDKESVFGLSGKQIERLLSVGYSGNPDVEDPSSSTDTFEDRDAGSEVAGSEPSFRIDGYEIIEKIAEAGQGQVWRALQRSTGRDVAIKVPRLGSVTSERARIRFEREIELAARLKHPNMARIYDSGVDRGQYYYVMDFVKGLNLDDYVRQHSLTHRQILELMRIICRAVQHAHQNGIIHRDLKPSNIIVTDDGHPFIVDFGLAKGFLEDDQNLAVSIDGETVGTPAYMSPEQAAGHTDEVDTRTDVYSLGVTLFTLLTDSNPHDLSGSRLEVIHRIADEEVTRPRSLNPQMDKDIEALLLKVLDRDPDGRYSSAAGLTEDLDNYLKGKPLIAGSQSGVYRLKKFVKRNKLLATSIAAVLVVLVAGVLVSTILAIGQARARVEAQLFADFLENVVLGSASRVRVGEPNLTLVLDATSEGLEGDEFKDYPLAKASIQQKLGLTYRSLGESTKAEPHLERAWKTRRQHLGPAHLDTIESASTLGWVYRDQRRLDDAERLWAKQLEIARRAYGQEHKLTLGFMNCLASTHTGQGRYKEAEALYDRILETAHRREIPEEGLFMTKFNLGTLYRRQGRYEEAERLLRETLAICRRQWGPQNTWALLFSRELSAVYHQQKRYDKAQELCEATLDAMRQAPGLGPEHKYTLGTKCRLARIYADQERFSQAEDLFAEVLEIQQRKSGEGHPKVMNGLAVLYTKQECYDKAEPLFKEALEARNRELGPNHPRTLESKNDLGVLHKEQGHYQNAERLLLQAVTGRQLRLGDQHPHTLKSLNNLIELYEAWNKPEETKKWRARVPEEENAEE